MVVSAQNGLNEIAIARVVGNQRTIGCFVNFGADYLDPGVVHYSGHGAVVIGELDGTITPRIQTLHRHNEDALRTVGSDLDMDHHPDRASGGLTCTFSEQTRYLDLT